VFWGALAPVGVQGPLTAQERVKQPLAKKGEKGEPNRDKKGKLWIVPLGQQSPQGQDRVAWARLDATKRTEKQKREEESGGFKRKVTQISEGYAHGNSTGGGRGI